MEPAVHENPTTSYKSNGTNGALPPMPTDEAAPTSLSSINSNGRGRHSQGPSKTSLLSEGGDAEERNCQNEGSLSAADERCGDIGDERQRATITGMICRKSKALMFGQILSLCLAATGAVQSSLYLDCGLSAPTFSMFLFYLPLCIICSWRLLKDANAEPTETNQTSTSSSNREELQLDAENSDESFHTNGDGIPTSSNENDNQNLNESCSRHSERKKPFSLCRIPLQSPPWKYATVAVADVYANYTTILAFKYTTITSVSLFDALAIPSAMLISRLLFGRMYTKVHLLAVAVCCIGISINVLQDFRENERIKESGGLGETAQEQLVDEEYPYKIAGDLLAITGGVLFGVSNTLSEVAVRDWGSQNEYLSAMTFIASIITLLQTLLTERQEVMAFFANSNESDSCSESGSLTLLAIFVIASVINYIGIASFLGVSDAAFLNLSLLTGDAWAVAFSVYAEGIIPPPTFYVALVITLSGVFIYETAPSPTGDEDALQQRDAKEDNGIEMRSNQSTTEHELT